MWLRRNILYTLIIVNLAVYVFINIVDVIGFLFQNPFISDFVIKLLAFPSDFYRFLFRFWTILTYMFTHEGLWHLLGNMLWFYFLGTMLINVVEQKDFLILYFFGGIAGALMFFVAYNVFPVFAPIRQSAVLIGASASVTAIVIAIATISPNEIVYLFGLIRVRLYVIAIFMLLYDIFLLDSSNSGGHFAHLGGALYGFVYGFYLRKGINIQSFFHGLFNLDFDFNKKKRKFRIIKNNLRTSNDYEYNMNINEIRREIDRLLDKIKLYGYDSLSKKEREFLKKYSKYL